MRMLLVLMVLMTGCGSPERTGDTGDSRASQAPDATPIVPESCLAIDAEHPLYVMADAPEGGDGSPARPFRLLQDAVDAATNGTTVLVAPGSYARGFRAMDPRRHAVLTVRGCEPQGTVIKDDVVFAGNPSAQLGHVELADVEVVAKLFILNTTDGVLRDVQITGRYGGTLVTRTRLRVEGTVDITTEAGTNSGLTVLDGDLDVAGNLHLAYTANSDFETCYSTLGVIESGLDVQGTLAIETLLTSPFQASGCAALRGYRSTIAISGSFQAIGDMIGLWSTESTMHASGPIDVRSTVSYAYVIQTSNIVNTGAVSGAQEDTRYPAIYLRESTWTTTQPATLSGGLWVVYGENVLSGTFTFEIAPGADAGIRFINSGSLTLDGDARVLGGGASDGVQLSNQGGWLRSLPGSTLTIAGVERGILGVGDGVELHGLRMHDVAGEGIIATSPVTGSDWILTDIVGHALRATDTTVDIQQATFTRTGGLYADGGALRLSDTRLAAIGFEAIAVHVSDGTLDAERLECDGADTACISLMNAGGSLRDVRIRATPLPIVQWGCSDRTPPLDITAYFCEDCVDPTVHRCDGVQP